MRGFIFNNGGNIEKKTKIIFSLSIWRVSMGVLMEKSLVWLEVKDVWGWPSIDTCQTATMRFVNGSAINFISLRSETKFRSLFSFSSFITVYVNLEDLNLISSTSSFSVSYSVLFYPLWMNENSQQQ